MASVHRLSFRAATGHPPVAHLLRFRTTSGTETTGKERTLLLARQIDPSANVGKIADPTAPAGILLQASSPANKWITGSLLRPHLS
jgi:hypothetical protein